MLGVSQQQLAEMIRVTYQQAHKYERGINRVSAGRLFEIARALSAPISYFYEGIEQEGPRQIAPHQRMMLEIARNFAVAHHLYVVLKGHRTIIATPDEKVFINPTGNPGMATGGTGDVLTGMIAAWLAQLLDAEVACKLAVYLHGLAGDLAEADEGEVAMTSTDVAGHLGDAILELTARRRVVDRSQGSA